MDGSDCDSGDPAGTAPARAAGRRPFRDLGSQRSLSSRDQPQQPPQAPHRTARARHHRSQRKADAAGIGRRSVRQRSPWPRHHGRQQASVEIALRYAQGQAGPLPPEPSGQAGRLFGPFGHRHGSGTQAAPVWPAQEDGARAVQAVHLFAPRSQGPVVDGQAGQEACRERASRGLGYPRRGYPRAPGSSESRPDVAPPRHSGVRTDPDRGQGDPAAPARLFGLQRRLRRRPDGRARAPEPRGPARSARSDDVDQQRPVACQRCADHRSFAGHDPWSLLHDHRARRHEGRRHGLLQRR